MLLPIRADTVDLQHEAYRLRYQVFCVETRIFDSAKNPDEIERDEFDDHSVQGLLFHCGARERVTVGTVRLILPRPGAETGSLPFHRVCQDPRVLDHDLLPIESTFELSRFAISKKFRRRIGDAAGRAANGHGDIEYDAARMLPHICLSLMTMALQMGIAYDIETVCAAMEPSLLRLLTRFGIHFKPLGPTVWYYGWRQPVYARVGPMLRTMRLERPEIWGMITDRGRLWPARFEGESVNAATSLAIRVL